MPRRSIRADRHPGWGIALGFGLLTSWVSLAAQSPPPEILPPAEQTFLWGVSTSAYQTEDPAVQPGQPEYFQTDWDLFVPGQKIEAKGNAVWSYSRTDRDLAALEHLGVNAYRFSIEWARVEPTPGTYNEAAIRHYVDWAHALRQKGIEPVVCLWHITFPDWLTNLKHPRQHGWLHPQAAERWAQFVRLMTERLGPEVRYYAPQNEPNTQSSLGYLVGLFSPGAWFDLIGYDQNNQASAEAFIDASRIIKEVNPGAVVISVESAECYERSMWDPFGLFYSILLSINFDHMDRVKAATDWVGINYYFAEIALPNVLSSLQDRQGGGYSEMGWAIDPPSLYLQIQAFSERYGKPIIVMENGVATLDESQRSYYLLAHVEELKRAQADGYDLRGYFYWSLMDNWEWTMGYGAHFGLFDLSKDKEKMSPRPTAQLYTQIIRQEIVPVANPDQLHKAGIATPSGD